MEVTTNLYNYEHVSSSEGLLRKMLQLALKKGNRTKLTMIKSRRERMEMEDSFGVVIRAKGAAAIAEGEKATLYHLAREKKNGAKSSFTKLKIKEKVAWECFDSCNDRSSTDVNPHRAGSQDAGSSTDAS